MPNRPPPRPALTQFARILLTLGSGESGWLIVAFVLGLIALGVASNFVYTRVVTPESVDGTVFVRVLLAVGGIILAAYGIYQFDLRRAWQRGEIQTDFDERNIAAAHAGLVWLLSPGALDLPLFAIRHHTQHQPGEVLQHCWILVTPDAEETYQRLAARAPELGIQAQLHAVPLNEETIEATYRAVDQIYQQEAARVGLRPEQIIADLTSGLKPMTAGMVLACLPYGHALEYVKSQRDPATGQFIPGTQRVVQVGVQMSVR